MGRYGEPAYPETDAGCEGQQFATPVDRLFERMARNYAGMKNYPEAMEYYAKAYHTADSLHKAEVETELSELSIKYENQEKELEIARLHSATFGTESQDDAMECGGSGGFFRFPAAGCLLCLPAEAHQERGGIETPKAI